MTTHKQLLALALLAGCAVADESLAPGAAERPAEARGSGGLAAPSDLGAIPLSSSQIAVAWRDNSNTETGFEVHRSTSGASGSFTLLATVGANVQAFTNGGLASLSEYCYKVRAARSGVRTGYSAFSNTACATTLPPPPPPPPSRVGWVWAEDLNGTSVMVEWFDQSAEDGYRVERSPDGVSAWEPAGVVGADVTSFTGADPVWYRVVAFNAGGEADPSDPVPTAPGMPTGLTLVMLDADNFELTWRDNSGIETEYEVWFGGATLEDWDDLGLLAELPADATRYGGSLAGMTSPNYPYVFKVMARKDGIYSSFAEVYFHTQ